MNVPTSSVGSLIRYIGSQPNQYSGVYLDTATNQWVVAVPDGADMATALHAAASQFPLVSLTSPHTSVTVTHEKRSLSQLRQIETQVRQGFGGFGAAVGNQVSEWGLNEQTNTVQVGVTHLTSQLVGAAHTTYGDSVQLMQVSRSHAADWHTVLTKPTIVTKPTGSGILPDFGGGGTRLSETLPLAAGDRILTFSPVVGNPNQVNVTQCTSGWNTPSFMFTAGHCFTQGTMVDQGFVDSTNTLIVNGPIGSINTVQFGNSRPDWESINTVGVSTLAPEVYTGGPSSSTGIAQESLLSAGLNEPICTDGSFTGESCNGTIDMTEGCVDQLDDSGTTFLVCNQDFAVSSGARLVQHGDSGGPVFAADNGFISPSLGVISGGNVGTVKAPGPGDEMNFTDGGDICNFSGECGR